MPSDDILIKMQQWGGRGGDPSIFIQAIEDLFFFSREFLHRAFELVFDCFFELKLIGALIRPDPFNYS